MKQKLLLLCCLFSFAAARATVYYVDGSKPNNSGNGLSWGAAKRDIQWAIQFAANNGDEVWVKAGTYFPTVNANNTGTTPQDRVFCIKDADIKFYGGFNGTETAASQRNPTANPTILSGDLDGAGGTADAYHVVLTIGRSAACVVDGFTITGGRATGSSTFTVSSASVDIGQGNGAGVYNLNSSPTISNCLLNGDTAIYGGGMYNENASPLVKNCTFTSNTAYHGGGIYNSGGSPVVNGCAFSANLAHNEGGGISNAISNLAVSNCVFTGNRAEWYGGGIYAPGTMSGSGCTLTLSSSTFYGNTTNVTGAGIWVGRYSGGSVTNCIFDNNTTRNMGDAGFENVLKGGTDVTLTVSYSLISDYVNNASTNLYTSGAGIVAGYSAFVNPSNPAGADGKLMTADDGLRIGCASAARDAGTGSTPATDISGNPRVGVLDMGAYEHSGTGCPDIQYVNGSMGDNSGNGYSWVRAKKDVQVAINAVAAGGEVWVKKGTYLPTEDANGGTSQRDKTFYLTTKDVKLYGGFAGTETALSQRNATTNVTTLSGDLDGPGGMADAYHVLLTFDRTNACVVDGFTISGGRADGPNIFAGRYVQYYGGGMLNYVSSPVISNCIFSNNTATFGGGMLNTNSSLVINNCTFSANTATNYGGGMLNDVGGSTMVTNCVFFANTAPNRAGGLYNGGSSNLLISNCTFWANTTNANGLGAGVYSVSGSGGSITNTIFYGNTGGPSGRQNIYKAGASATLTVSHSLISDYNSSATNNYTASNILTADPLFVNATNPAGVDGKYMTADDGLRISCASPARDAGTGTTPATDILGAARVGGMDMGAYEVTAAANCPNVLYVDGAKADNSGNGYSWQYAKRDVQAAINAATSGAEIWVKAGIYLPTEDPNGGTSQRDKTFYLTTKDVKLYGGFSGTETLLSQRNAAANVTTLSGDLDGSVGTNDAYRVLLMINRTSACVVDGFTITGGRGIVGSSFAVSATATTIYSNDGGGMYNISSNPVVSNCVFAANTTVYGGGIYNASSSPVIDNCVFSANTSSTYGGGIYNANYSNATVRSCFFSNNTSYHGGGMFNNFSSPTLSNCLFSANTASNYGGGIFNFNSSPSVNSCTFSSNTANTGGGMYYAVSGGSIINTILYGNTGGPTNQQNIYKDGSGAALMVSHTLIGDYDATATNNYTATNILTADPLFIDAANPAGADGIFRTADDGLRLQSCSPAINAGTGTTPATDISGNARVGAMDLGAYEYGGTPSATLAVYIATDTRNQQPGSTVGFGGCGATIAQVFSTGAAPVSGSVMAKVYVQGTAPSVNQTAYVRRYYNIAPATNPDAATAQITLYFTQADFDDYNTARGSLPPLPMDATDAANHKANLRVTQEHGTSATGDPNSYSGWGGTGPKKVLITPASVVWNTVLSRWEVTFPVTGFSGFFVTSAISTPLPLELLHFTARRVGEASNQLDWATGEEEAETSFVIERSSDAKTFGAIGVISGKGVGSTYRFMDNAPLAGANYYRLQVKELGKMTYSPVVLVKGNGQMGGSVELAPNPATEKLRVVCRDKTLEGSRASVWSTDGRMMTSFVLEEETVLDIRGWAVGVYLLRLADGSTLRLIKQ